MDKVQGFLDNKHMSIEETCARIKTMTDEEKLLLEKELGKDLLESSKRLTINYKRYLEKKRLELGDDEFEKWNKQVNDKLKEINDI